MKKQTTSQRIAALQKIGDSEEIRAKIAAEIENADTDYKVDVYLKEQGINYAAQFVPQAMSRNAGKEDKTINWRVTLANDANDAVLSTDYSQGIGHVPEYVHHPFNGAWRLLKQEQEVMASGSGRYPIVSEWHTWEREGKKFKEPKQWYKSTKLPEPTAASVIYGLLLDSSVSDHTCFEDWASEFGYDTDSREAEHMYNACKVIARDFLRVFNATQRAHLQTLLQDY